MNSWLSGWTKKRYKEVCKDLCTCFIKRGFSLSDDRGYEALITSDTCMYISSFEKMRREVIERTSIVCFIDTRGTNAHPDVFDANAGWVLWNHPCANIKGSYFKLNHPIPEKGQRLLEALADPDCGWLYRVDAKGFEAIPGSPIAYWATTGIRKAFNRGTTLENTMLFKTGMVTGDNERFLRLWWETSRADQCVTAKSNEEAVASKKKWFPYNKGGEFRRWYGNNDYLVNFEDEGAAIFDTARRDGRAVTNMRSELRFRTTVTWSLISSALPAFRLKEYGFLYDKAGLSFYPPSKGDALYALGLCNSSFSVKLLQCLAPTLNFQLGDIWRIPFFVDRPFSSTVESLVEDNIALSRSDWDAFEDSWNFKRHPII